MKKFLHISPDHTALLKAFNNAEEYLLKFSDGMPVNIRKIPYVIMWDDIDEHCELTFKSCLDSDASFRRLRVDSVIFEEALPSRKEKGILETLKGFLLFV